jgi:GntR family transcriptional regulator
MPPRPLPTAAALFSVSTGSAEPIYKQLQEQVKRLVAGGQLAPGDELPSVRDVAAAFAVNPMTVSKAYGLLEAAGVLERRRGLGMVVAEGSGHVRSASVRAELLRPTLEKAALEAAQLEIEPEQAMRLFEHILKGK